MKTIFLLWKLFVNSLYFYLDIQFWNSEIEMDWEVISFAYKEDAWEGSQAQKWHLICIFQEAVVKEVNSIIKTEKNCISLSYLAISSTTPAVFEAYH